MAESPFKVLVADDDPISRRLLEHSLAKWGYEVVSAGDGDEAWKLLNDPNGPNLAILDWVMPGLDGDEICRRMRAEQRPITNYVYAILLTSRDSKEDLVNGIESGADDYIAKPFDPQELRVRVRAGQRICELQSELIVAHETLRKLAMQDQLTGILNRGAILERLECELSRSRRQCRSLTVALADIDHFKAVNDTHGHQAGDCVLQQFVRRVESNRRLYDSIGRYGGEEFLIIIPETDQESARVVLERIRKAVADGPMHYGDIPIAITVSLGATISRPDLDVDALIQAADTALYRAKNAGRNRGEFWGGT
ncbi:diguanylate cyclase [Candidatus Sumerlaeota bacterium]|nr:diguanylate cyclase [Candidatus Sumerlaeota bacterium]